MTDPARLSWTDVRDTIRARILARDYAPGDRLPRDEDLAQELGCARTTVHRAMQDLAHSGLVERRRKGGTHVRADPVARATIDIPVTRLEVEQRGWRYAHQLIGAQEANSPPAIMARFGLSAPVPMLRIEALHLADARPYMLEDRWVDLTACPEIRDLDLTAQSANEWLVHHKPYSRLELRFSALRADGTVARHLAAPDGSALFVTERTTWNGADPITTVRAIAAPGYTLTAQS